MERSNYRTALRSMRLTASLLLFPVAAFCTNYYISNTGNDSHTGLTPALSWKTIDQLNKEFHKINAGDTIFFKRNESFYGAINVTKSGEAGKPIVFTAYGAGAAPVITGLSKLTGWNIKNTGIWQAPAPAVKTNLNVVTLDGIVQRIGRYPNADAPDGGYLRYEEVNGNISITDKELNDGINWTGAEVVIRKNHWTAERCRVTKQEKNTITYTYSNAGINPLAVPHLYPGLKGDGYFFQKDARTLDQYGEWFFDSTNGNLQVFLGAIDAATHIIKASTVDTLVNTGSMSFISFVNLAFEGANLSGIYNKNGGDISIEQCNFDNIGGKAIHFWNTGNVLLDHVSTNHVLSNAIQVRNGKKDNVIIKNCIVKNTGSFIGMGSFFDDRDYKGISVLVQKKALIENNVVDTVGSTGIQFQGNDVLVQQNFVRYYCYQVDDGAGIYTFAEYIKENATETFVNRVIKNNIVLYGIGAPAGSIKIYKAEGIYLDGRTMNVEVTGNTIAFTGNKGIACNNPVNITLRNNTCYATGGGWGASRSVNWDEIRHLEVKNNIFYAVDDQQRLVNFDNSGLNIPTPISVWESIRQSGEIDSNYYNIINPVGFIYNYADEFGKPMRYPSPLSFEHWQEFTGQDKHSKRPAKIFPAYKFNRKLGSNLVTNGGMEKDINSINVYGDGANASWDNSGKITGEGSLKVECDKPQPNRYLLIHGEVGALMTGKKYLFKFNTAGSSDCGIVRAYLRKTVSPYTILSAAQTQSFGSEKKLHEFLLETNISANASYAIEIERNSCTTYIDDIELYEADAQQFNTVDLTRFEYNATGKPMEIVLDKNYVGVDGTPYSGKLVLQPFSSKILIPDIAF